MNASYKWIVARWTFYPISIIHSCGYRRIVFVPTVKSVSRTRWQHVHHGVPSISLQKMGLCQSGTDSWFRPCRWGKQRSHWSKIFIRSVGLVTDNRFDQFCLASMTGGYQAQVSLSILYTINILTTFFAKRFVQFLPFSHVSLLLVPILTVIFIIVLK